MSDSSYLRLITSELVGELETIIRIKSVTANSDLLGRYTEARIRHLVKRIVHPMRVCSGAVLDNPLQERIQQIDLIIWAPFPLPAIFEVEDFGLVPKSSAFGVIEIKRSNYRGVDNELASFASKVDARSIVSEKGPPYGDFQINAGIGIICVLDPGPSRKLKRLLDEDKVVAIFEMNDSRPKIRTRDVAALVNFLHAVSWRYRVKSSGAIYPKINLHGLEKSDPGRDH